MFYLDRQIKNLLVCEMCGSKFKINDAPKILPCGMTICNNCCIRIQNELSYNLSDQAYFNCIICNQNHVIPALGWPLNSIVFSMLRETPHRLARGQQHDTLRSNLALIETGMNNLDYSVSLSEDIISDQFWQERVNIQLAYENLSVNIHRAYENLLKQHDIIQTAVISQHNKLIIPFKQINLILIDNAKSFIASSEQLLSSFEIEESELIRANSQAEQIIKNLNDNASKVQSNTINQVFVPVIHGTNYQNLLGTLTVPNNLNIDLN